MLAGRDRRQRAPGRRRSVGRARAAARARARRSDRHPARPGAGRGRGRVGGIFRPAGLHHDAGRAARRAARTRRACSPTPSACRAGGATCCTSGPCPRRCRARAGARAEPRPRGADPPMPGAVSLGIQPLQVGRAGRPSGLKRGGVQRAEPGRPRPDVAAAFAAAARCSPRSATASARCCSAVRPRAPPRAA